MIPEASLKPAGWVPKRGSRVIVLPDPKALPDAPEPPAGRWWVLDKGDEDTGFWWVMPDDGESRVWATVAVAGRHRDEWPKGWPGIQVHARRLFPAGLVTRSLF